MRCVPSGVQCAVYIPAGLPHAIEAERFTEGAYGGSCQIYLDKNYVTKPVPDKPLKADDTESLIVRDIQWVESFLTTKVRWGERDSPS